MTEQQERPICGIVMPISEIDGCNESHWSEVLEIVTESIESSGFSANLVSNADDVGIIHKRIIQNLYDNPIVVCDVSGKNPNVMFELGIRLAFDKPTIIIKDDKTAYSFDTSAIEHIEYPRDLRFSKIVEFKERVAAKIAATHDRATSDGNYTTFLKQFGEFTVAKLQKKEVSGQEFILEELKSMRNAMLRLEQRQAFASRRLSPSRNRHEFSICLGGRSKAHVEQIRDIVARHPDVREAQIEWREPNHAHVMVTVLPGSSLTKSELQTVIDSQSGERPFRNKSVAKS